MRGAAATAARRWLRGRSVAFVTLLGTAVVRMLGATCRTRLVRGEERIAAQTAAGRPVILAVWHGRLLGVAHLLEDRLLPAGYRAATLISRSRDGDYVARLAERHGVRAVRGSTTRGGYRAMRQMTAALVDEGRLAIIAPDGPRGPALRTKPGAIVLAQVAEAVLLPVGVAVDRCWRLGSWDRFVVPKPFARFAVSIGEPIETPRRLARGDIADRTAALTAALDAEQGRAEELLGGGAR